MTQEIVKEKTHKQTTGKDTAIQIEKEQVENKASVMDTKDKADKKPSPKIMEKKQIEKKANLPKLNWAISSKCPVDVTKEKEIDLNEKQVENKVNNDVRKSTSQREQTAKAKKVSPSVQDHVGDKTISKAAGVPGTSAEILDNITHVQNKQQVTKESEKQLETENTPPKSPQQRKRRKRIKSRLFQETISFSAYKRAISEEQEARRRRRELKAKQEDFSAIKEAANLRKSMKRPRNNKETRAAKKARKNGLSARPPFSTSPIRN